MDNYLFLVLADQGVGDMYMRTCNCGVCIEDICLFWHLVCSYLSRIYCVMLSSIIKFIASTSLCHIKYRSLYQIQAAT